MRRYVEGVLRLRFAVIGLVLLVSGVLGIQIKNLAGNIPGFEAAADAIEGLERFARQEPLRRVHECVFGVLALESEPVDPRL